MHPRKTGTNSSSARRCSTRKRARRGSARRSSWSTAATPAPAAATTSSSAARRRADSPVLRRPDLLRSLLAYWQNHPSLSWLFSGLFIGPTSQAPRVDEARNDSLYELEIAFKELPARPGSRSRHRGWSTACSATCSSTPAATRIAPSSRIDKLYLAREQHRSPRPGRDARLRDAAARAHEPRAASAAARTRREILARTVPPTASCAGAPTSTTAGCCRTSARRISRTSSATCATPAIRFEFDWFAPHFEFRFPTSAISPTRRAGRTPHRARTLARPRRGRRGRRHGALRGQLARTPAGQGARPCARPLRHHLQWATRAAASDRHAGEGVAGVRYRAWQPPSCLQPTIGVHAPLAFDLFDTWNKRSLGGCQYHVAHPGGRSYDTFPVNAYEAESRRLARFFRIGHTPGRVAPVAPRRTPSSRLRSICEKS